MDARRSPQAKPGPLREKPILLTIGMMSALGHDSDLPRRLLIGRLEAKSTSVSHCLSKLDVEYTPEARLTPVAKSE
jgi:hypothetical protein